MAGLSYREAGVDIGAASNFFDVDIAGGDLYSRSGRHQFIHSVKDLNIAEATSTAGNIDFDIEGNANVDQITALLGRVIIVADAAIIDRRETSQSNLDAVEAILNAGTGIGSPSNRFETRISRLEADVPGGG